MGLLSWFKARSHAKTRCAFLIDRNLALFEQRLKKHPSHASQVCNASSKHTMLHDVADYAKHERLDFILKAAALLLEHGADPNAKNHSNQTPLWVACCDNTHNYALASSLLQHGADPNIKDNEGRSPFHWIIWRDNDNAMAELMLKHGADPNVPCDQYKSGTALRMAKGRHPARPELVKLLEAHGGVDS